MFGSVGGREGELHSLQQAESKCELVAHPGHALELVAPRGAEDEKVAAECVVREELADLWDESVEPAPHVGQLKTNTFRGLVCTAGPPGWRPRPAGGPSRTRAGRGRWNGPEDKVEGRRRGGRENLDRTQH